MNLQHARISELCASLRLEKVSSEWPHLAEQAAREQQSFADFLERLLNWECEARNERTRSTLLKLASLSGDRGGDTSRFDGRAYGICRTMSAGRGSAASGSDLDGH